MPSEDSIEVAGSAARRQAEQILATATEARLGEEEIGRQTARLEDLRQRQPLLSVLDRSGLAVVLTDGNGKVARSTSAARRLLGIGSVDGYLTTYVPAPTARLFRDVLAAAKGAPGRPVRQELPGADGDAATGWVLCAVAPAADGEDVQAIWVLHPDAVAASEPDGDGLAPDDAVRGIATMRATRDSLDALLGHLSQYAVAAIGGADGASVTLLSPGSLGATSEAVEAADRIQYRFQDGPCYEALRTGEPQWTGNADTETRWPDFAAALAAAKAYSSIIAVPLATDGRVEGVLNVYARAPHAFDESSSRIARILAGPVAATLADARVHSEQAELIAGLQQAVESHRRVGQAIGILMVREGLSAENAFSRLRKRSNDTNRKLHDLAAQIVADAEPRQ